MQTDIGVATGGMSYKESTGSAGRRAKLAADFAYTLNHAIVCTITDPLTDVPIGAGVQNIMAKIRGSGNKVTLQDVAKEMRPDAIAASLKQTFTSRKELKSWLAGEVAGDFGSVPLVVGMQHYAPGLVNGIRQIFAPLVSPFMRRSAERTVRGEFKLMGQGMQSAEYQARVEEVYQREIEKLPNAIMWTIASPAINIAMQKLVMKSDAASVDLLAGKAIGSVFTSGLTVGLRNTSPVRAQQWDDWMSRKATGPVTSAVSKILGVEKDKLEKDLKAREQADGHAPLWEARVKERTNDAQLAPTRS